MSERMIALADAADAVCEPCRKQDTRKPHRFMRVGSQRKWTLAMTCRAMETRARVEREHPGLGSKPTSEWRR